MEQLGIQEQILHEKQPIINNQLNQPCCDKMDGNAILSKLIAAPVTIDGKIVAIIGFANKIEDYDQNDVYQITALMEAFWNAKERREVLVKLQVERNKYLSTLLSMGDGVLVLDQKGKIEIMNKAAEQLTGWKQEEAIGRQYKEVFVLAHEDETKFIADPVADVLKTGEMQEISNHGILKSRDGKVYYLDDNAAPIMNHKGELTGVVLVFRDITETKEQREKIEYLSYHDSLTGLYNRRYFEQALERMDKKENLPISVIIGDVNGLKLTNDIFGHATGDKLLQKAAKAMRDGCNRESIIARWGGDEFIILLPRSDATEADAIMQKIAHIYEQEQVKILSGKISLGAYTKAHEEESIFSVIENAENNMYEKKILGRDYINKQSIETIIAQLYENSPRERSHAIMVSQLCMKIGKAMNLSEVQIRKLREEGLLHDIGKIVIENELLNKQGVLSEHEMQIFKQHPVVAFRILNTSSETLEYANDVLDHHEKWDGTGYPRGLKGEAIPLLSRIIAIAESYDVLTNPESYQQPISKEEALQTIREKAGTYFDPEIALLFVKIMEAEE